MLKTKKLIQEIPDMSPFESDMVKVEIFPIFEPHRSGTQSEPVRLPPVEP